MTPSHPPDLKPWCMRHSQTMFQNRWLRVDVDVVELPDGRLYDYTVIREKKHAVAVIALNAAGQVLLQREYRHPVAQVIWQVPGGLMDDGEMPLAAAQRELREETGHEAEHWRYLGALWDNPALEDMEIHLFLAQPAFAAGPPQWDEEEWIQWQWQSWSWLQAAIRRGEIKERVILAAVGLLWAHGDLPAGG